MHVPKSIALAGIVFLMIVLLLPGLAAAISPAINPTPSVVSGLQSSRSVTNSVDGDYFTFPGELPDTLRVLAIRVHFQPDTLSKTFGDGDFMYDFPDTVNPDGWILDSPPHDKQFFLDQLLAARNYFSKYSYGNLTLAGIDNADEGGDVYPAGDEQSYLLEYPIWTVNYGNDDHERLNQRLVDLFVDAWTLADSDPDVSVADYDLFIVFHAGAGNEFDTGFDMTPFDIPSVFISENDLSEFGNLPNGIPMSDGIVRNGIILPETQRQLGVDVGMHGTVVAQIGFAIGLPHLYNTENGDAGIGMLGLMDRGFGVYFGTIPIPPSAWSRIFMGWDEPVTVSGFSNLDTVKIGGLHLPDSVFSDDLDTPGNVVRLLRIPINDSEYYLAEARMRDPDEDSLAFGWDRDGRMITFHDDYSWEAEDGFRVAVEYSDHDFDLPASGVLLWHVDDERIRKRYSRDDLQNSFDYRAIRLEEADGVWDIGNEYPFLTAGDGTEYGYFADAFYRDNEFWRETNRPLFNPAFGSTTAPSSISNDGGFTHITLSHFSDIGDTMSFDISNSWVEDGFPREILVEPSGMMPPEVWIHDISLGDITGDGEKEIVIQVTDRWGRSRIFLLDGRGNSVMADSLGFSLDPAIYGGVNQMALHDMNGDGRDDIVLTHNHGMAIVTYDPNNQEIAIKEFSLTHAGSGRALSIVDYEPEPYAVALFGSGVDKTRTIAIKYSDPIDTPSIDTTFGDDQLRGMNGYILSGGPDAIGADFVIWFENMTVAWVILDTMYMDFIELDGYLEPGEVFDEDARPLVDAVSAAINADGVTDYVGVLDDGRVYFLDFNSVVPTGYACDVKNNSSDLRVMDLDRDGKLEPVYLVEDERSLVSIEADGLLSENSPLDLTRNGGQPISGESLLIDSDGDGNLEWIALAEAENGGYVLNAYDLADGRMMPGFPLELQTSENDYETTFLAAGNLDEDEQVELVVGHTILEESYGSDKPKESWLTVYNLPGFSGEKELVWSEAGGNPANTRFTSIDLSQSGSRADFAMDDAYCWPNPVLEEDMAHFRYPGSQYEVEVVIYDIAGREKLSKRGSSQSGGLDVEQAEIEVDVSSLPSGVYVARLEVGSEIKLIRFAVVN